MIPRNPFTTLYVTERMEKEKFPELFSPVLLPYVLPLFDAGNVVISGTQGTGKSMLLALLQTDIRLAFEDNDDHAYPVEDTEQCQFLGAGINLATNQALQCVARWSKHSDRDNDTSSLVRNCFVDYVNVWILRDLLRSIAKLLKSRNDFWKKYELGGSLEQFNAATKSLGKSRSLRGVIIAGSSVESAIDQLTTRIDCYLGFFNGRPRELPKEILASQTFTLGQPISDAVNIFRESGCISPTTRVLITIDQFEQLLEIETALPSRPYHLLRAAIDEAIHRREPTLSIRIGTRPHAWETHASEAMRDYHPIDLDELLRRKEHGNRTLFPSFVADFFVRRLQAFGNYHLAAKKDPMKAAFGSSPKPDERVLRCGPVADWGKVLRIPKGMHSVDARVLRRIARESPIDGKLGTAWCVQQLKREHVTGPISKTWSADEPFPWNTKTKHWWRKERLGLAVLQLAADNRQRVVMYGRKDVTDLSGSNILVFGSICQQIWECWIREVARGSADVDSCSPIDWQLQCEGILGASSRWHEKLSEEPWVGDTLKSFIDAMGTWLRHKLAGDSAMSYPGGNGISLANRDLALSPEVEDILEEGTGRGFLQERKHTPKHRSRGHSTKWFLHPILAPYYELTVSHTKEPLYVRAAEVEQLLRRPEGKMTEAGSKVVTEKDDPQLRFPGFVDPKDS